ncbi:hypothetical protein Z947_3672 [Sulfitobacter geojensis]|nr:hypothetical protein Z947_3672 [Sulfitobacter geojensis]
MCNGGFDLWHVSFPCVGTSIRLTGNDAPRKHVCDLSWRW